MFLYLCASGSPNQQDIFDDPKNNPRTSLAATDAFYAAVEERAARPSAGNTSINDTNATRKLTMLKAAATTQHGVPAAAPAVMGNTSAAHHSARIVTSIDAKHGPSATRMAKLVRNQHVAKRVSPTLIPVHVRAPPRGASTTKTIVTTTTNEGDHPGSTTTTSKRTPKLIPAAMPTPSDAPVRGAVPKYTFRGGTSSTKVSTSGNKFFFSMFSPSACRLFSVAVDLYPPAPPFLTFA